MHMLAITFNFNAADLISPAVVGAIFAGLVWVRSYLGTLLKNQHAESMSELALVKEQTTKTNGRVSEIEAWKNTQEGINKVVLAVIGDKPI